MLALQLLSSRCVTSRNRCKESRFEILSEIGCGRCYALEFWTAGQWLIPVLARPFRHRGRFWAVIVQQQSLGQSPFRSLYNNRDQTSLEEFTSLLNNTARFQGADCGYCLYLLEHFQGSTISIIIITISIVDHQMREMGAEDELAFLITEVSMATLFLVTCMLKHCHLWQCTSR